MFNAFMIAAPGFLTGRCSDAGDLFSRGSLRQKEKTPARCDVKQATNGGDLVHQQCKNSRQR